MAQHKVNYTQSGGLPVALTSIDKIVNWGRSNSIWALTYGLACCGIEMMASGASRYGRISSLRSRKAPICNGNTLRR